MGSKGVVEGRVGVRGGGCCRRRSRGSEGVKGKDRGLESVVEGRVRVQKR